MNKMHKVRVWDDNDYFNKNVGRVGFVSIIPAMGESILIGGNQTVVKRIVHEVFLDNEAGILNPIVAHIYI